MLSEWHDTAAYLTFRVGVESLVLSLVCDLDPVPLASASGLQEHRQLYSQTSARTAYLESTALITPWKEVTGSRQDRGYQVCLPPCYLDRELACPAQC